MTKYEAVIIFDPLLSDEELKSTQDRICDIIRKEGGEVTRLDSWGKKRLAFDIKKRREGFYNLLFFSLKNSSNALTEMERFCRLEEKVLRHMICHEVPSQFAKSAPVEKPAPAVEEQAPGDENKIESEKTPEAAEREEAVSESPASAEAAIADKPETTQDQEVRAEPQEELNAKTSAPETDN